MKFLSLVLLSGFLTVSCAHKSCCKKDADHCDKSEKSCCKKMEKEDCKDGHCKKEEAKKQ
jgi:hypothetical protein